jgi:hypothetical protein
VGGISSQRNGSDSSHDLLLGLDLHGLSVDLGDGSVSSSEEEVSVVEKVNRVDALREESLDWSNSLEKILLEINLNNISGFGSKICKAISWVDDDTGKHSLDGVHENVGVLHLLLDEIAIPSSDAVVVDGEALGGGGVEEFNLVGRVHANWISN